MYAEWNQTTQGAARRCAKLTVSQSRPNRAVRIQNYAAFGEFIETKDLPGVTAKVHASMLEELSLEDRINDEVRVILEAYSDEMRKSGANYQEMFRKVKNELVRKYKAVL